MREMKPSYDAVVIGGGIYGCSIALSLKEHLNRVLLIEREPDLLCRASYINQARIHNGYHYPRSFITAYRSSRNFWRFVNQFRDCVIDNFVTLYCLARASKTNRRQFERFCDVIGAPLRPARSIFQSLFSETLIERIYEVEEFVFDARLIRELLRKQLEQHGIQVSLSTAAAAVQVTHEGAILVSLNTGSVITTARVFNCTYSAMNQIKGVCNSGHFILKHEIAEIALVEMPQGLDGIGITVMDGPFFSVLPFPTRRLHSLTHVRYTPHASWSEDERPSLNPHEVLGQYPKTTRARYMLKDAQRYIPSLAAAKYKESLFEVKTVLVNNEADDGRPILFEKASDGKVYSVLGSKIDNVYDALARVNAEVRE